MYRRLMLVGVTAVFLLWTAPAVLAQQGDEYQLPPVKLKPDRPTTTEPIPPAPDDQGAAKEPAPPAEPPAEPAKDVPPPPPADLPPPPEKAPEAAPTPVTEEPAPTPPAAPSKPAAPAAAKPAGEPMPVPAAPKTEPPLTPQVPVAKPNKVEVPKGAGEERLPQDVEKEAVERQIEPSSEADMTGVGEVGLVEEVARARKAYARALQALTDYYQRRGNAIKLDWVNAEIASFNRIPKMEYLGAAEWNPGLKPLRRIEAADQLYQDGMDLKNYPAMPDPISTPGKESYLRKALEKFKTIIEKYPDSDKIADAAFRMGEIYGGFYLQDYTRGVQCYEKCWQWNPKTQQPAIFNAAKIYDEHLKNRSKAVELYNRVIAESSDQNLINYSRDRIKTLTGK